MALAFSSAAVNAAGTILTVTISGGTAPLVMTTNGFVVHFGAGTISVASFAMGASTAALTLANKVYSDDTVTVSYSTTSPAGNLHDSAGTPLVLGSFTAQSVTNNSTVAPIAINTAAVTSNGWTVTVPMLLPMEYPPVLPATAQTGWAVTVTSGASPTVTAATASGSVVTLTLSHQIFSTSGAKLAYSGGNVTDSAGSPNSLANTSNITIGGAPTLQGEVIGALQRVATSGLDANYLSEPISAWITAGTLTAAALASYLSPYGYNVIDVTRAVTPLL